jgi:hypothetical protein
MSLFNLDVQKFHKNFHLKFLIFEATKFLDLVPFFQFYQEKNLLANNDAPNLI